MPEVYDNATSPGTTTSLTLVVAPTDVQINVAAPASTALQAGNFRIMVIDTITGNRELMMVTGGQSTNVWQVTRAIEGTSALSFPPLAVVKHVITAGSMSTLATTATRNSSLALGLMTGR